MGSCMKIFEEKIESILEKGCNETTWRGNGSTVFEVTAWDYIILIFFLG